MALISELAVKRIRNIVLKTLNDKATHYPITNITDDTGCSSPVRGTPVVYPCRKIINQSIKDTLISDQVSVLYDIKLALPWYANVAIGDQIECGGVFYSVVACRFASINVSRTVYGRAICP